MEPGHLAGPPARWRLLVPRRAISGFSLTHLSGPGCPIYGDVPILPTVGAVGAHPRAATQHFAHTDEHASPGRYAVTFPAAGIGVDLAVTTRTGLGRFTFPRSSSANLLFKADRSAAGVDYNDVRIVGNHEITGSVMSGHFCGTPSRAYTLYFSAEFNRPFTSSGMWVGRTVAAGARTCAGPRGSTCGAWVSFDTRRNTTVLAKVGISFVSVAGARANLRAENTGWDVASVQGHARSSWNALLGRIRVAGGTAAEQRTFYTALYHSLLHPNVFSDADGRYIGFDDRVHRAPGHTQYANVSDWDIYRSEVQLLALVAPQQTSDMMQSLVNDASQGGWLPKWPVANAYTDEMNGDSSDPILASAYAFGARQFDAHAALAAMVRGATKPGAGQGWYPERQDLGEYLARGWVHADSRDLTSSDYTIGGSETLEYAIDDFAISRFAHAVGDEAAARTVRSPRRELAALVQPEDSLLDLFPSAGHAQ